MTTPLHIVSAGIDLTDGMRNEIAAHASRLSQSAGRWTLHRCQVAIARPAGATGMAQMFNVRLRVTIDGVELAANQHEHPDFHVALGRAFDSMQRQIRTYRGTHNPVPPRRRAQQSLNEATQAL